MTDRAADLDAWMAEAAAAPGTPTEVERDLVLELARVVAHAVARPAAPLTAYLLGVAVAQGLPPAESVARLRALAEVWPSPATPHDRKEPTPGREDRRDDPPG
jgi:hypothetical protein